MRHGRVMEVTPKRLRAIDQRGAVSHLRHPSDTLRCPMSLRHCTPLHTTAHKHPGRCTVSIYQQSLNPSTRGITVAAASSLPLIIRSPVPYPPRADPIPRCLPPSNCCCLRRPTYVVDPWRLGPGEPSPSHGRLTPFGPGERESPVVAVYPLPLSPFLRLPCMVMAVTKQP